MKVFIDTNIIIGGPKYPEHLELKRKAKKGEVTLYFSIDVDLEQSKRSLDHYFGPYSISFDMLKSNPPKNIAKIAHKIMKKQHEIEIDEKAEWAFWRDCDLEITKCTINGLISMAQVYPQELLIAVDTKGEINLLEELLSKYSIHNLDAMHLMTAHSAELEYFLTWDKKLIKRASKVEWLKPRVITPTEFLNTSKEEHLN